MTIRHSVYPHAITSLEIIGLSDTCYTLGCRVSKFYSVLFVSPSNHRIPIRSTLNCNPPIPEKKKKKSYTVLVIPVKLI